MTHVILKGVVGSTAFGLAHAESDKDYLGIFMPSIADLIGLKNIQETVVTKNPDCSLHSLQKYCSLALKCNPTILDLLWLDDYEICTDEGWALIDIREAFLSQKYLRSAFGGYALSQAKRLVSRSNGGSVSGGFDPDIAKRTAKHGRHCLRLCIVAEQALSTGKIIVDVSPWRDEIFAAGEAAERDPYEFEAVITERVRAIDAMESLLPMEADFDLVNTAVIHMMQGYLP